MCGLIIVLTGLLACIGAASSASNGLGLSSAELRIDGPAALARAGSATANAGDVNGDGRPDVIVGAGDANRAYVVFGPASPATVDLSSLGGAGFEIDGSDDYPSESAGFSVAGLGDLNHDGKADVVVGDPNFVRTEGSSGATFVIFGKATTSTVDVDALGSQGFRILGPCCGE